MQQYNSPQLLLCSAGDQFALFESIVTLAVLLRRFEFSMAPDAPPVGMTTVRSPAAAVPAEECGGTSSGITTYNILHMHRAPPSTPPRAW